MLVFIDTADIKKIKKYEFVLYGVTTTPTIIKRDSKLSTYDFLTEVRYNFPDLEIHVEALAENADFTKKIILENFCKAPWYDKDKIVFKIPVSIEGIKATIDLNREAPDVRVNLHMAFSIAQSILAMQAEPIYVSPLIGRYADRLAELHAQGQRSKENDAGLEMLAGILASKRSLQSTTLILASSIRTVHDFVHAVTLGVDAITLPPSVLKSALEHPMTIEGVAQLWKDLT